MTAPLTFTLENRLAEIERVSHLVEEYGERHAVPPRIVFAVNLALDEVLTNVISYAYDDGAEHEIVVRLSLSEGELLVEVEDDGRPFNPMEVAEPDVGGPAEDRAVGGLGLRLVRKLMTEVAYRRQQGKNVFVMRRAIAE